MSGRQSAPDHLARTALLLLAFALALGAAACEEEPPPPNHIPTFSGDATITCVDGDDPELTSQVLAGGEVSLLDENLVSVEVLVGGYDIVQLSSLGDVAEPDAEIPQGWSFEVDPESRILCGPDLFLTFTAYDEEGETVTLTTTAE